MNHLFISELLLLFQKEKKARKIKFDQRRTLIQGKNHTGKSSLIKSIYRTLGAEVLWHKDFKAIHPVTLLKFSVEDKDFQMLRDGDSFALFNGNGEFIRKYDSVSKELAPSLSELFNFKPLFQTPQNTFKLPPPAFLFLPYYVDQDNSWNKSWNSFERLTQFKGYRNQAINYHSGLRPNEYYETKKEIEEYVQAIASLSAEQKVITKVLADIREQLGAIQFNIDVEQFREEINQLLIEASKLKEREELLKHNLLDLYNIKSMLQSQLEIVKRSILENHSDLEYLSTEMDEHIDCPLCGAQYQNSFTERFAIANDERKGKDLLIELNKELSDIEIAIEKENTNFVAVSAERTKIEELMLQKKGDLQLKDVINSSGKNQVRELFNVRNTELNNNIIKNDIEKKKLEKKIKALEDRKRKKDINNAFSAYMSKFCTALDIRSLKADDYKSVSVTIEKKERGSTIPRALIAYYYSFFYLMQRFSSTTYCPLIIDSPNQQDQDVEHIDKILGFINDNQPENSQLILGLAETYGVNFNCHTIELTEKYSLLQQDEFNEVYAEIAPKLDRLWHSSWGV